MVVECGDGEVEDDDDDDDDDDGDDDGDDDDDDDDGDEGDRREKVVSRNKVEAANREVLSCIR